MKKRVITVFLLTMFAGLFLFTKSVLSAEKIIELSYSYFMPAEYYLSKDVVNWAREIEKQSAGEVKITIHFSGTLTSPTACYDGVVKGISDIGQSVLSYSRGRFPIMEAADLPGYPFNALVTSHVSHDLYKKFKPKELADTHVLYLHAHIPGGIYTRNKPVRTLEDLKGLRIRCTGLSAKIVGALGATPVAMPKGEQYDALSKGVVDGTVGPPSDIKAWRVAEVTKYFTEYSPAGYVSAFFIVMNLNKWNSLPPHIQNIFTKVSEDAVETFGKGWNRGEIEEGFNHGKKIGFNFISISPEEGSRWDRALAPLYDDYLKEMETKRLPGREVLEYRAQLIKKYNKMYPPLKSD